MDNNLSPLMRGPRVTAAVAGTLVIESGSLRGQRFLLPLPPSCLVLGRDAGCSICFPSEAEADRLMGRRHAQIEVRSGGVFLVDLNSANGTMVQFPDGKLAPVSAQLQLQDGMRIALGGEEGTWIAVQLVSDASLTPSRPAPSPPEQLTVQFSVGAALRGDAVHSVAPGALPSSAQPLLAPEPPPQSAEPPFADHVAPPVKISAVAPAPWGEHQTLPSPREVAERARPEDAPSVQDRELRRHRVLFMRQIAAILTLLLVGCAVGVALGLRSSQDEVVSGAAE